MSNFSFPCSDVKFDLQERNCELPQLPPLQPLLREESSRCTVVLRSSVEVSPRTGEQQAVGYVGTGGTYPEVLVACALCWGLGWLLSICRAVSLSARGSPGFPEGLHMQSCGGAGCGQRAVPSALLVIRAPLQHPQQCHPAAPVIW